MDALARAKFPSLPVARSSALKANLYDVLTRTFSGSKQPPQELDGPWRSPVGLRARSNVTGMVSVTVQGMPTRGATPALTRKVASCSKLAPVPVACSCACKDTKASDLAASDDWGPKSAS
jgi:hypothetical protein